MLIHHKLPSALTLDVYGTHCAALTAGKKFSFVSVPRGDVMPVYIVSPQEDKYVFRNSGASETDLASLFKICSDWHGSFQANCQSLLGK